MYAIHGFSRIHLTDTGGSDFGDIMVAPTVSEVCLVPNDEAKSIAGYSLIFEKKDEITRASYYQVYSNPFSPTARCRNT